jgi:hypothetical protein
MTTTATPPWEAKRTDETRMVEDHLRPHFQHIDDGFEGMSREKRDAMAEEQIDKLPPKTQRDIVTLFTFTRSELAQTPKTFREFMQNTEFENPSPTML